MGEIVGITRVSSPVRSSVRRSSMSMWMRGLTSSRDQLRSVPHCLMLVSTEAKISGSGSKHRQLHEAKAASQSSPIRIRLPSPPRLPCHTWAIRSGAAGDRSLNVLDRSESRIAHHHCSVLAVSCLAECGVPGPGQCFWLWVNPHVTGPLRQTDNWHRYSQSSGVRPAGDCQFVTEFVGSVQQVEQFFGRYRFGIQTPLPEPATHGPQLVSLSNPLNAFGHHLEPKRMRHGHDGVRQGALVEVARSQTVDERLIDLDLVDLELLQEGQAGITRAEVVDSNLHTHSPEKGQPSANC